MNNKIFIYSTSTLNPIKLIHAANTSWDTFGGDEEKSAHLHAPYILSQDSWQSQHKIQTESSALQSWVAVAFYGKLSALS